jgi:hypothetical protein
MPYLAELHYCACCKEYLGPDNGDGICYACDRDEYELLCPKCDIPNESWRDIPGYAGRYQASTLGRIRSVDRKITQISRWGRPFTRHLDGKILSPAQTRSGHLSVVLGHGAHGSLVHQLVLRTFLGATPDGMEVRHLNGNPQDNRVQNLVYGTRTENILDVFAIGKPRRVLTADEVLTIRGALSRGETGASIAKRFGISESNVSAIKNGVTYWWL